MFRKTPKDGEDSPNEAADAGESAQARYQQGLQDAKRLVQSPSQIRDPEHVVRALVNLKESYEQLCAFDPVFRAEENQLEVSQFAEAQHKLIQRLQLIAKIKPNLYRIARSQSQYTEMYPPMPSSPTDVPMHESSPGFKWTNLLKDWQPFRRTGGTAASEPTSDHSPMEVDQTLRLADGRITSPLDLTMWHLTRMSNAKLQAESRAKLATKTGKINFKKRSLPDKPGRAMATAKGAATAKRKATTRPIFRPKAVVPPGHRGGPFATPTRLTTPGAASACRDRRIRSARPPGDEPTAAEAFAGEDKTPAEPSGLGQRRRAAQPTNVRRHVQNRGSSPAPGSGNCRGRTRRGRSAPSQRRQ